MVFRGRVLTALGRIGLVIGIAAAFMFGLLGAVYLSLHSSETSVPDVVGQDRFAAEEAISKAHLNFRVRATRPGGDTKPDTVLVQTPRAGEIVKVGQTVAVDISRPAQEGESAASAVSDGKREVGKSEGAGEQTASSSTNENRARRTRANKNLNSNDNSGNGNRNANRAGAVNAEKRASGEETGGRAPAAADNANSNQRPANSGANRVAPSEVSRPTPRPSP